MLAPPKPPSHDELEALIKEARERRRRRHLLNAAGVAIVAALGLGIYALVGGFTQRGGTTASSGAIPPPCRLSQLSVSSSFAGVQPITGGATLVNRSGTTCSLPHGWPAASILWRGNLLPTRVRKAYGMTVKPVSVLEPGDKAEILIGWKNWCGPPQLPATLQPTFDVRFRNGLDLRLRPGSTPPPRCVSPAAPSGVFVSTVLAAG